MHSEPFHNDILSARWTRSTLPGHLEKRARGNKSIAFVCFLCVSVETRCSNRRTVRIMLLARRITYFWRAGASGELAPDRLSLIRSWHKHGSPPVASKSLLRVTTPLMAPLLRAGQQPSTRSGTRPPYSVPQSLFKQIWFGLLSFQRAARGWDAACVSLCIFRDQASGASLWSPQLNLEPSCFRNSPRNSTACPDFLKHYLGREVGGAVEEEGERDGRDASFFFYSRRLLRLKYIHHHNTCKGEASPVGQDICRTDTHTYTNKPVVGALLYFACFVFCFF